MTSEIRFTTSADGTAIAYTTFGSGPPLIELPRWAVTIEWNSSDDEFAKYYEKLGRFRQVTIVERRGTGSSQRAIDDCSMEAHVADVRAVVAAAGLETFDLMGSGDSAAVCIRVAAEMPDRVQRLVLWAGYSKGFGLTTPDSNEADQHFADGFRTNFPATARLIADAFFPNQSAAQARRIANYWVQWVPPENAVKYFDFGRTLDVSSDLQRVAAPTMVIHRRDQQTGHVIEYGQAIAAGIRDSRLVIVDGDVGIHQYEHDEIIAQLRSFLGADGNPAEAPTGPIPFRTVLFTDLVGHTEMMQRLGDKNGRAVLREHERITREVLRAHGGTEVKTMGDGFMASFGSVTKAVECAVALQRAFDEHNRGVGQGAASSAPTEALSVRVGLNAGEPIEEDGDLFGSTVILASRIAAAAQGGEVLASMAVRELCAGKGFLFADRGEQAMRGFEDPVRVFEVSWRG